MKALALLSSLPTSWEVFNMTMSRSSSKLILDDTIGMVLFEELGRKSMVLFVNDTIEAYSLERL